MSETEDTRPRYKSSRNGAIGILIAEKDNEVILEVAGVEKTITTGNFKKFYTIVQATGEELEKETVEANAKAKKTQKPAGAVKDNGDDVELPKCGKIYARIQQYLEGKDCQTKQTCSYLRIRINKRNIAELSMPKKEHLIKFLVRNEAIANVPELATVGRKLPAEYQYAIDHEFKIDTKTEMDWIYKLLDTIVEFEKTRVVKTAGKPKGAKNKPKKVEAEAEEATV